MIEQIAPLGAGGLPGTDAAERLFKSKNTGHRARPQDQRDFELALPHLDAEARAWLQWALVATEPRHPWLASLVAEE